MAGIKWSDDEINFLKNNCQSMTCQDIGIKLNRTTKSVQHMFNILNLTKHRCNVGDIVNGWQITEIYIKNLGSQNVRMAKVKSTLGDCTEKEFRLTKLNLQQVGWPDRRRPDNTTRNTKHGESTTRLYRIWAGMIARCKYYHKDYSARGIVVTSDWLKYENFRDWSNKNGYADELTLDRINVDGNYEPSNCRWCSRAEQVDNKRNASNLTITAFGETKTVYEWSRDNRCTVSPTVLSYRITANWNTEKAISTPSARPTKMPLIEWLKNNYLEIYNEYLLYG